MALPTIASRRSSLFYTARPGNPSAVLINGTVHTGNVFFVMTGGSDSSGAGDTPDNPFATIDFAIGQCTANQGDAIYVMPGYTQNITGAAGIASDKAGVTIIGLGEGAASPLVSWSATDSTWAISAASTVIRNIRTTSSVNECVSMFNITAADVILDNVPYIDSGAALEAIQFILTSTAADRLKILNSTWKQANAAAAAQLWIKLVATSGVEIINCQAFLDLNDDATSTVLSADTNVRDLYVERLNGKMTGYSSALLSFILGASGATGTINHCNLAADVAAITTINDFPSGYSFEVYASRVVDKNGKLDPVV